MLAIELINVKAHVHLKLFIAVSYICVYMFSCFFCCRFDLTNKGEHNIDVDWSAVQRCIAVDSTLRHRLKAELFSRAYGVSINI